MDDIKVYDGWLKVFKRKVGEKTYDILQDYDAVAAVVVNEYNEILLVKQFRPALMEETLEIPAGCLDIEGEDEKASIVREILEETGLRIKSEEVKYILSYKPMVGFSNSLMKLYLINVKKDMVKLGRVEDEDVYEVLWMDIDKLGQDISQGKNLDIKTILAYYYLKSLN
jgi:ADP-ribose pyrophosphatase